MKELERITKDGLRESSRSTWREMAPKIISQARLEGQSRSVVSALNVVNDFEGMCVCVCFMCEHAYKLYSRTLRMHSK